MLACFAGAKKLAGMRERPKKDGEVGLLGDEARKEGELEVLWAVCRRVEMGYCLSRLKRVEGEEL